MEVQGSLLVIKCSLAGVCLVFPPCLSITEAGGCSGNGMGKVLGYACPQPGFSCLEVVFLSSISRSYEDRQSSISRCRMPNLAVGAG